MSLEPTQAVMVRQQQEIVALVMQGAGQMPAEEGIDDEHFYLPIRKDTPRS
jgi:hypothetical protein